MSIEADCLRPPQGSVGRTESMDQRGSRAWILRRPGTPDRAETRPALGGRRLIRRPHPNRSGSEEHQGCAIAPSVRSLPSASEMLLPSVA